MKAMVKRLVSVVAGGMILASGLAIGRPGVAVAAETGSVTFDQPGPAWWTVPWGVNVASFTVLGARGGRFGDPYYGPQGGAGGEVDATISVYGGETLSLMIGEAGGN